MSKNKWLDKVEYIETTYDGSSEQCKIIMFNGGNGDLYISVCPKKT